MSIWPEATIIVWLLPLALLTMWLLVRIARTIGLGGQHSEKRRQRRINSNDLMVEVNDGGNLVHGVVCNISVTGMCVMGLPGKLQHRTDSLAMVVNSRDDSYPIYVTRRWEKTQPSGRQIGVSVEYAPDKWYQFVRESGRFAAA